MLVVRGPAARAVPTTAIGESICAATETGARYLRRHREDPASHPPPPPPGRRDVSTRWSRHPTRRHRPGRRRRHRRRVGRRQRPRSPRCPWAWRHPPCESPGRWPSMSQSTRSTPPTTDSRCPTTSATTPPGRVSTRRSSTVWRRPSGSCLPPADTRTDSTHRAVRRTRRHNDPHLLFAVGTPVTRRPPHRSGRARLRHPALPLGVALSSTNGNRWFGHA